MSYTSQESGDLSTTEFRVFAKQNGSYISYLHDIPLYAKEDKSVLNMVVEIPRGTNAKMEICLSEEGNPIKQDVKNGKLRMVDDVFPYTGYIWNYGALPQTWENPTHKHPETQCFGDNDPLDACEIGSAVGVRGEVKQVKPLGVMALIDEGETDWKVIVIDVNDPRADEFNDITDVQRLLPGFTMATYEWFRTYKIPAGKPANEFAFNGEAKNREYTQAVIEENHQFWKGLASGEIPAKGDKYNMAMANVSCEGPHKKDALDVTTKDFVPLSGEKQAAEVPPVSIKRIVEEQQCNQPHGTADLSMVIQALAGAAQKGVTEGAAGIRQVLADQACRAVYNADSETPESTNADGHYTIHYYAKDGLVVYGVYQQATPHRIEFSAAEQVAAAGYDMVAAAFAHDGKFTFTTRHGAITFTVGGVVEADDLPKVESDNLLAVKAPLAFFQ